MAAMTKLINFKLARLLHADISRDMEQVVESTKLVPTCKEERKNEGKDNKGIGKCNAQNHSNGRMNGR